MARSLRLFSRVLRAPLAIALRRLRWGPLLFWVCFSAAVQAGTQREEPLIDSVRTALSAAVHQSGPPVLVHGDVKVANAFQQWLTQSEARLEKQLQRRKASPAPANLAIAAATSMARPMCWRMSWRALICAASFYKPFGTKAGVLA